MHVMQQSGNMHHIPILIRATDKARGLYAVRVKGAGRVFVLAVNGLPRTAWPTRHVRRLMKR
jgi:hypothetical protein